MAQLLIQEERPKKSLLLRRFKINIPKTDLLGLIIVLLIITNILTILILRTVESGIVGLTIGLVIYFLLKKEEAASGLTKVEIKRSENKISMIDVPDPLPRS